MAQKYADRIFMNFAGGQEISDIESISIKRDRKRRPVDIMSRNRRNVGFVEGNLSITVDVTIAVQNKLARPKFESIDYELNDVQITCIFGADQFVLHGVFLMTDDDTGSAPGDEVKTTFTFGALDETDAIGNSALLNVQLK